ncbi:MULTISPECIES: hypothetical protein [unclassified Rhodanobacter]|uniref:hypothetical protein n=1 Tax=unclassified Rhodanobacter TaxID=2621553 RepID=UPI001BDF4AE6|nr:MULTISPECIES: hypothetical protein [unclassified Rhodanobacter]MBT2143858.1 hypothetical protein [Rhodanobacter sp. LX-99]MBT2147068.1 hypothetical protein [Rhodanobacter sp. LX-100]
MTRSMRFTVLYGATVAGLLLGGCGKNEPAPAGAPAPASTAPATTTTAPAPASTAAALPPAGAAPAGTASVASAASVTSPAAMPAPLTVAKLTLGSAVNAEHQVTRASSSFATDDKTIYASVATEGSTGGATLNAKWSYLEGQGQLVSSISQSIATDGPAVTTFKVQNPDLWPEGKYKVEISLDGKPVAKQDFAIRKS